MIQENDGRVLSAEGIDAYMRHLREQERSAATISKYACDLEMVRRYFAGRGLTKEALIHWKEGLKEKYAATSVNTIIAALNGFLKFMEWFDLIVKCTLLTMNLCWVQMHHPHNDLCAIVIRCALFKSCPRIDLYLSNPKGKHPAKARCHFPCRIPMP